MTISDNSNIRTSFCSAFQCNSSKKCRKLVQINRVSPVADKLADKLSISICVESLCEIWGRVKKYQIKH